MPHPSRPLTRRGATVIEFGCLGTMIVFVVICATVGWSVGRYLGLALGIVAGLLVPVLYFVPMELRNRRHRKAHAQRPLHPPLAEDGTP